MGIPSSFDVDIWASGKNHGELDVFKIVVVATSRITQCFYLNDKIPGHNRNRDMNRDYNRDTGWRGLLLRDTQCVLPADDGRGNEFEGHRMSYLWRSFSAKEPYN